MKVLTKFQEKLLKELSITPIKGSFFLTGGTALSAFYLRHRFSEDLDFFTQISGGVVIAVPILKEVAEKLSANLEIQRRFNTFLEGSFTFPEGEIIRIHFAEDAPYRLEPTAFNEEYGVYVDSLIDICCNKFSTLFDRHEMKDFVDVYFIDKEGVKFDDLYPKAQQKHMGIDDYWLCQALRYINEVSILPKMIKPVTVEELRNFFNQKVQALMRKLGNRASQNEALDYT